MLNFVEENFDDEELFLQRSDQLSKIFWQLVWCGEEREDRGWKMEGCKN